MDARSSNDVFDYSSSQSIRVQFVLFISSFIHIRNDEEFAKCRWWFVAPNIVLTSDWHVMGQHAQLFWRLMVASTLGDLTSPSDVWLPRKHWRNVNTHGWPMEYMQYAHNFNSVNIIITLLVIGLAPWDNLLKWIPCSAVRTWLSNRIHLEA